MVCGFPFFFFFLRRLLFAVPTLWFCCASWLHPLSDDLFFQAEDGRCQSVSHDMEDSDSENCDFNLQVRSTPTLPVHTYSPYTKLQAPMTGFCQIRNLFPHGRSGFSFDGVFDLTGAIARSHLPCRSIPSMHCGILPSSVLQPENTAY